MKKFIRSISERATRPSLNIDHLGRMKRKKKKSVTCSVLLHGVESAKQFLSSPQHGQASEHPPFSSTLHTQGLTFFKWYSTVGGELKWQVLAGICYIILQQNWHGLK